MVDELRIKDDNLLALHSPKIIAYIAAAGTCLIVLLCLFLSRHEMRIEAVDVSGLTIPKDEAAMDVRTASYAKDAYGNNSVSIKGWCVLKGRETAPIAIHVVLKDRSDGTYYQLPTTIVKRENVTKKMDDGVNYDNSGFSAVNNRFPLDGEAYDIYLSYEIGDDRYLIDTQKTVERQDKQAENDG